MNKKLSDLILSTQSNLVINSELAVKIGLNEAIVLRQIYYWLEINEELQYHGKLEKRKFSVVVNKNR